MSTTPATRGAEELRTLLGHGEDRHRAHAVSDHHRRPARAPRRRAPRRCRGPSRGSTGPRAPRPRSLRAIDGPSTRIGNRRQVDPLLVPDRHVQAEPVGEEQERARRARRRPARRSRFRRRRRPDPSSSGGRSPIDDAPSLARCVTADQRRRATAPAANVPAATAVAIAAVRLVLMPRTPAAPARRSR